MRRDGNRRNEFEGNIANSVLRENEDNIIEASFSERFSEQTLIIVEDHFQENKHH